MTESNTSFKLNVLLRGDLTEVEKLYSLKSFVLKDRCELKLIGVSLGLAKNMSWSLGPNIARPEVSGFGGVEMYRFGVCLYADVELYDHIRANLKIEVPDTIDFVLVDYYNGILIAYHDRKIIIEEALPVMMLQSPQPIQAAEH